MRRLLFLVAISLILCGCAVENKTDSETTAKEYETTATDSETTAIDSETTVGGSDDPVIDGNMEITVTGTPYTEEEIMTAVENAKEYLQGRFEPGSYLSRNGYYLVSLYAGEMKYDFYILPVVKDHQIIGEGRIERCPDGPKLSVSPDVYSYAREKMIDEKKELAMIYSLFSEYGISADNEVSTVHGNDNPEILNAENLYNTFNFGNNLLTEKIFDESDYYYKWE